ncbi:hypothetical protein HYALB_00012190 [Hymenoscyphus albidus]|uniref:DUF8035 domain-containing protein n=1 Tax=Hymenoscyphus albidus TaxID=595503 RepID=A0A9N9LM55_9HELO|nr:hypothetical protein HYALB_00012190 [Hymenoscyphus albidus]
MSRRADTVYEERDYYRDAPPPVRTQVRERNFEETDVYSRRGPESARGSRPDFLRDDYGRTDHGQMVVRERDTEITRPAERTMDRTLEVRRARSPSPVRIREERRERIIRRSPSPPPAETTFRSRVVERERARSLTPPKPHLRARVTETRERIRERSPSPIRFRERVIERERERTPSPVRFRERIIERQRERTPSPPRIDTVRIRNIERETKKVPTPAPSPSPSPPPAIRAPPIHQEIITHHRHIDHGFERARVPTPPPPPRRTKEIKETDIDIHTSRGNTEIDIKTSRSKTPQPTSNSLARRHDFYDDSVLYDEERDKLRVRDTKIDLSRRRSLSARPGRDFKVDIRETRESYGRDRDNFGRESVVSLRGDDDEAEYYRRKADERAYIGEAFNGATKDWSIVDVPPGTERVQMDGVGGGSQEITWQRYNGVRRSKFIPERERIPERFPERERERIEIREREEPRHESSGLEIEISSSSRRQPSGTYEREYERIEETSSDRRVGMPRPSPKNRDLWTEITKDLVVEEAIRKLGYSFEETEYFYYIIEYLRYEDVLELVEVSEQIRRDRQHRIREIERERERFERRAREREEWERAERRRDRDSGYDDERIIEREIVYEGDRRGPPRRRGGGW